MEYATKMMTGSLMSTHSNAHMVLSIMNVIKLLTIGSLTTAPIRK